MRYDDIVLNEAKQFVEEAKRGDKQTLTSVLGWDAEACDVEGPGILQALLSGDLEKARQIAVEMTERVANLYAKEEVAKRYAEPDFYFDDERKVA